MNKIKIAVMVSTNGTDLQAIIDSIKSKNLDVELSVVFANKKCYAIERSKEQGFTTEILIYNKDEHTRESYDKKVAEILDKYNIELIVLVGYMRLFSPWFCEKYNGKIINIHPSLLPSFPGMDKSVHEEVLEHGCKVSGCTIHFVDSGMDTGPIIAQGVINIENNETINSLKEKVQNLEKKMYPEVIQKFAKGKIKLNGRKVIVE